MALIDEKEFKKLTDFTGNCVSIFIPTQRAGKEVLEEQNKTHLKSLWKEIKTKLSKKGVDKSEIEAIDAPIQKLLGNREFWRHQSDGLAIFAAKDFFEHYSLPLKFEAHYYINKEFYIKPIVPIFSGDGRFNLLSLQVEGVKLYEATKYSIGPVEIEDLVPQRLEDRVGYDYEEKTLQHKSGAASMGQKNMHGHAGADRERKDEILRFFRAVDQGLNQYLQQEKLPLLVACQDYLFSIYKEANTYQNLYPEVVPGNPGDTDMIGLHEKAWQVIGSHFESQKREKLKQFEEQHNTEKTSAAVHDILPAIHQGKVDTLFLENQAEVWGTYDTETMKVEVEDQQNAENISLMNWAASKVLEQGGSVFLIENAQMPEKSSKLNAIYRY